MKSIADDGAQDDKQFMHMGHPFFLPSFYPKQLIFIC